MTAADPPAAGGPPGKGGGARGGDGPRGTAAWVDGVPVAAADVLAEVERLRSGPAGTRLPRDGTADGRQLRRWVAQRVVVRRLLDAECAARGLDPASAPPLRPDPSLLGTATADVLTVSRAARAVYAAVVADVGVPERDVRAAYDRDRPTRPERWTVRQAFSRGAPPTALPPTGTATDPATLLPEVRAAVLPGVARRRADEPVEGTRDDPPPDGPVPVRSSLGWHLVAVDEVRPAGPVPYEEVRDELAAALTGRARQTAFARWLDAQVAGRVRLAPGFEHPADPANPDATHRH
jgi:[acyl-carrier-protein] S-malonyltransferase